MEVEIAAILCEESRDLICMLCTLMGSSGSWQLHRDSTETAPQRPLLPWFCRQLKTYDNISILFTT